MLRFLYGHAPSILRLTAVLFAAVFKKLVWRTLSILRATEVFFCSGIQKSLQFFRHMERQGDGCIPKKRGYRNR